MFFIKHTELDNSSTALLEIEGPLNSETSSDFEEYVSKLLDNGIIYLLVDAMDISFISSEGIGVVILIQKRITSLGGTVVYFNFSSEISALFKLLGFEKVLSIASGRDEALLLIEKRVELGGEAGSFSTGKHSREEETREGKKGIEDMPETHASKYPFNPDPDELESFVIQCAKCSSYIRVHRRGEHYCPYCSAAFSVNDDGNAVFKMTESAAGDEKTDFL